MKTLILVALTALALDVEKTDWTAGFTTGVAAAAIAHRLVEWYVGRWQA